jgi:hypothetical protein
VDWEVGSRVIQWVLVGAIIPYIQTLPVVMRATTTYHIHRKVSNIIQFRPTETGIQLVLTLLLYVKRVITELSLNLLILKERISKEYYYYMFVV